MKHNDDLCDWQTPQDAAKLFASRHTENGGNAVIMPDNAFIEAFDGRFRVECLNAHWFPSLADAREKMEDWHKYYNEERPHGAIGQKPPVMLLNHVGATSPPS